MTVARVTQLGRERGGASISSNSIDIDSAQIDRVFSSAGNLRKWAFSYWFKMDALANNMHLINVGATEPDRQSTYAYPVTSKLRFQLKSGGVWRYYADGSTALSTGQWYHVLEHYDSDNATLTNRVKVWVNGNPEALVFDLALPQYTDSVVNTTTTHTFGNNLAVGGANDFDGLLYEPRFFDGVLPDISELVTGSGASVEPIVYTGNYGTEGCYLDFEDNSPTTDLGLDVSGNNNHYTPAGTYSQSTDTPMS